MRDIKVKVHPSKSNLKKEDQLAWKIAEIASDKAKIDKDAVDMVFIRIIDNATVDPKFNFAAIWSTEYRTCKGISGFSKLLKVFFCSFPDSNFTGFEPFSRFSF